MLDADIPYIIIYHKLLEQEHAETELQDAQKSNSIRPSEMEDVVLKLFNDTD